MQISWTWEVVYQGVCECVCENRSVHIESAHHRKRSRLKSRFLGWAIESGEMKGRHWKGEGQQLTVREQLPRARLCSGPFICIISLLLVNLGVAPRIPSKDEQFRGSERSSNWISLHSIRGGRDETSTQLCPMPKPLALSPLPCCHSRQGQTKGHLQKTPKESWEQYESIKSVGLTLSWVLPS